MKDIRTMTIVRAGVTTDLFVSALVDTVSKMEPDAKFSVVSYPETSICIDEDNLTSSLYQVFICKDMDACATVHKKLENVQNIVHLNPIVSQEEERNEPNWGDFYKFPVVNILNFKKGEQLINLAEELLQFFKGEDCANISFHPRSIPDAEVLSNQESLPKESTQAIKLRVDYKDALAPAEDYGINGFPKGTRVLHNWGEFDLEKLPIKKVDQKVHIWEHTLDEGMVITATVPFNQVTRQGTIYSLAVGENQIEDPHKFILTERAYLVENADGELSWVRPTKYYYSERSKRRAPARLTESLVLSQDCKDNSGFVVFTVEMEGKDDQVVTFPEELFDEVVRWYTHSNWIIPVAVEQPKKEDNVVDLNTGGKSDEQSPTEG